MKEYEFDLFQPRGEVRKHYEKLKKLGEAHITHAYVIEEGSIALEGKIASKKIDEVVEDYCSEEGIPIDKLRALIEYSPADVDMKSEFQAIQMAGGFAFNLSGSSDLGYQQLSTEGNALKGIQILEDLAGILSEMRASLPDDRIRSKIFFTDGNIVVW